MTDKRKYILELTYEEIENIVAGLERQAQDCVNASIDTICDENKENHYRICEQQHILLALHDRIMADVCKQEKEGTE